MTLIAEETLARHGCTVLSWNPGAAARWRLLRLDLRLIDQHDRDIVLHRIDPMALNAFQAFRVLTVLQRLLTGRTDQNFQQILGNHAVHCTTEAVTGRTAVQSGNHLSPV